MATHPANRTLLGHCVLLMLVDMFLALPLMQVAGI